MSELATVMNDLEMCTHPTPSACRKCTHKGTPDDCPHCFMRLAADALDLLKEQKEIIDKYHEADAFLAVHGWQWKKTTTESSTNPKDGEQE